MAVYEAQQLTWTDVRALDAARLVAVLPTGAVEAHGPHLPLATDVVIAGAMARAGASRLAAHGLDVLLLPPLPYAPAPFAAAFPGTLDVPASLVAACVLGVARSLGHHGVRTLAVANAHHDPAQVAALRAAAETSVEEPATARVVFPDLTRRHLAVRLGEEFASGACHAGRYESSIVLAERPDWVRGSVMATLPANPRSLSRAIRDGSRTFEEAGGPDAYFGAPAEATAEEGRTAIAALGRILCEAVLEARS